LHYTRGYGYYEEYKNDQTLTNYGVTPVVIGGTTITNTDLMRRLWLDNDFYGLTYNFNYKPNTKLDLTLGGAYNEYKGRHYDNIEWTQQSTNILQDYEYAATAPKKQTLTMFWPCRVSYRRCVAVWRCAVPPYRLLVFRLRQEFE
jgi:iron complex outermembrane receptor protein